LLIQVYKKTGHMKDFLQQLVDDIGLENQKV